MWNARQRHFRRRNAYDPAFEPTPWVYFRNQKKDALTVRPATIHGTANMRWKKTSNSGRFVWISQESEICFSLGRRALQENLRAEPKI
jgi:hypothetical protein